MGKNLPIASLRHATGGRLFEPEKRVRSLKERLLLEAQRINMAWAGSRPVPPMRTEIALTNQVFRLRAQRKAAAKMNGGVHGPGQGENPC